MSDSPFDPTRNHAISFEGAATLVQRFQGNAPAGEHLASAFNRSAFEQLLAQPDAAGIRIYRAQHEDGSPGMVLVAVDAQGQDLAGPNSVFIHYGTDCPPYCVSQPWA